MGLLLRFFIAENMGQLPAANAARQCLKRERPPRASLSLRPSYAFRSLLKAAVDGTLVRRSLEPMFDRRIRHSGWF